MFAEAFAQIAGAVSGAFGGPYFDARIITQTDAEYDEGGSLATGDEPAYRTCQAQVDAATEAMRLQDGFTEADKRILVLAATVTGGIDTGQEVEMLAGPDIGVWSVQSVNRNPMAVNYELRARPV